MRILGPPSADRFDVRVEAARIGAAPLFMSTMFEPLWDAGLSLGVDPVGVVAQSYKETGGGTFRGKVRPEACNPCGLKIRVLGMYGAPTSGDEPLAHAIFPNWTVGARAMCEHLRAYAGSPVDGMIVDPRYHLALKGPRDWCESFEDLSGKWAVPGVNYGQEIVAIARRLQGVPA